MCEKQVVWDETELSYKRRKCSVNSSQVTTGPDGVSDSTLPSESHVIFRIQPLKVILRLPVLWQK